MALLPVAATTQQVATSAAHSAHAVFTILHAGTRHLAGMASEPSLHLVIYSNLFTGTAASWSRTPLGKQQATWQAAHTWPAPGDTPPARRTGAAPPHVAGLQEQGRQQRAVDMAPAVLEGQSVYVSPADEAGARAGETCHVAAPC